MASILVIDSEETVRTVVAAILQSDGHTVRATGEFNEALAWLHDSPPDLVLTNVFLQGIAGHDAMLRLRQEFPRTTVLMVSGLPDEEVIQEWTRKTGFDVFPKPFTSQTLLDKVRQMLD